MLVCSEFKGIIFCLYSQNSENYGECIFHPCIAHVSACLASLDTEAPSCKVSSAHRHSSVQWAVFLWRWIEVRDTKQRSISQVAWWQCHGPEQVAKDVGWLWCCERQHPTTRQQIWKIWLEVSACPVCRWASGSRHASQIQVNCNFMDVPACLESRTMLAHNYQSLRTIVMSCTVFKIVVCIFVC